MPSFRAFLAFAIPIAAVTLTVSAGCGSSDPNAGDPSSSNPAGEVAPNTDDATAAVGDGDGGKTKDASTDVAELSTNVATFCSPGDWCWSYPRIIGDEYTQITGTSDTDIWLLSAHPIHFDGKKLQTYDGILPSVRIDAIASVSPTDAWAFGSEFGGAYRWNGTAWKQVTNMGVNSSQPKEARVFGSKIVLAGYQVVSKQGADPWKQEETGLHEGLYGAALALAGTSENDIWVAAKTRVSHWDGLKWTVSQVPGIEISSIDALATTTGGSSELWLAGKTPGTDGVAAVARPNASGGWDVTPTTAQYRYFESVRVRGAGDVWAAGYGLTAHFTGGAWSFQPATDLASIHAMFRAPSGSLYATGRHGRIRRSDKPGASFTWLAGKEDANDFWLDSLWGSSASDVWAVGQSFVSGAPDAAALLLHFDGTKWNETPAPPSAPTRLLEIRGSSASNVWAAGDTALLRFDGTSWSVAPSPPGVTKGLIHVHPRAPNDVWAFELAYHACRLHHYDGVSWTASAPNPDCEHAAIGTAMWAFTNEVWVTTRNVRVSSGGNGLVRWNGSAWSFPAIAQNSETAFFALDDAHAWFADGGLKKRNAATGAWTKIDIAHRADTVFAFADNDVWTTDSTSVRRFDGTTWSEQPIFDSIHLLWLGSRALYGSSPNDMWFVFNGGLLRRKK